MAYQPLPPPGTSGPTAEAVRDFLLDVGSRREFRSLAPSQNGEIPTPPPYPYGQGLFGDGDPPGADEILQVQGLRLHGAQIFVDNFARPDTEYTRNLFNWQTGAGKTMGALTVSQEFVRRFRMLTGLAPAERPTVFVIGFSKSIIQAEMLRHPDFVTPKEVAELGRLRALAKGTLGTSPESRHLSGYVSMLKRRITDRTRGGYYRFMGYKEFANRVFTITRRGHETNFSVASLYTRTGADEDFMAKVEGAVRDEVMVVNTNLLGEMRGGLVIADEIHNTYNIQVKNNYGVALQYALDFLGKEAPRAVFMSATVVGGSAMEIVDLLNFLIPLDQLPGKKRLARQDFFRTRETPGGRRITEPLPGALERIGRLSAGRVSYLLDVGADPAAYPERIFEGVSLDDASGKPIPYLRFTPCPMSGYQTQTLDKMIERKEGVPDESRLAIPTGEYALYDMVYPNPEFPPKKTGKGTYGLYSSETPAVLSAAPAKWKAASGVEITRFGRSGDGPPVIGGPYLAVSATKHEGVGVYSEKYRTLAHDVVAILRKGEPGKMLVYHHRVRLTGVLQIAALFEQNGFVGDRAIPKPTTMCSVCGVVRKKHVRKKHQYRPARYLLVASELDRSTVQRNIAKFNEPSNNQGYEYRALIGSKMIREGYDLKAIRFELIASIPTDIPTLLQIFGRAIRKGSHSALPPDQRDVRIRIYVTTAAKKGGRAPELERYAEKMREYALVQSVEREIRRNAVDAFMNYEKVVRARPDLVKKAGIDTVPYEPVVSLLDINKMPVIESTFEAYGYGTREVHTITESILTLFKHQPVWTYEDLWGAVRSGAVKGIAVDPQTFSEDNFALALSDLAEPGSLQPLCLFEGGGHRVSRIGKYYLATPTGAGGVPVLDIESYVRKAPPPAPVRVCVSEYVRNRRAASNYNARLSEFEAVYSNRAKPIEDILLKFDAAFQTRLVEGLVERPPKKNTARARALEFYQRLRVVVTAGEIAASAAARKLERGRRSKAGSATPVGYVGLESVKLLGAGGWYDIPPRALDLETRHSENAIVVGYVESKGGRHRFKIRPPLHEIARVDVKDARSLARGAVCATRSRAEQEKLCRRLEIPPRGSATKMCRAIFAELLRREEKARRSKAGRQRGERWFYLFNEALPAIHTAPR
jgi:hypothetical protein